MVTPIIVGALGTEQFGIWALIGSILAFIGLLDLGIGPSRIRFAAEQRGRNARDETSELTSTAFAIYLVLAVVAVLLAVLLAFLLPLVVDISDEYVRAAQIAVVVSVDLVLRFPLGLFGFLLAGQQRYDVLNVANILGAVLYFGLAVLVLYVADGGLVALAVITAIVTAFRLLLPLYWLRRELPELRLRRSLVTRRQARELLSFSSRNMLIQVASKVVFVDRRDRRLDHPGQRRGRRLRDSGQALRARFRCRDRLDDLFPLLSELEGADERERQERYLHAGVRLGVAVVVAVGLPLVFLPDNFLAAWLPDDFDVDTAAPILAILMVSLLLRTAGPPARAGSSSRAAGTAAWPSRGSRPSPSTCCSRSPSPSGRPGASRSPKLATEAVSAVYVLPYLPGGVLGVTAHACRRLAAAGGPGALAAIPTLLLPGRLRDRHARRVHGARCSGSRSSARSFGDSSCASPSGGRSAISAAARAHVVGVSLTGKSRYPFGLNVR